MTKTLAPVRLRTIGGVLLASVTLPSPGLAAAEDVRYDIGAMPGDTMAYDIGSTASTRAPEASSAWVAALAFATADDEQAFDELAEKAASFAPPDARGVAKAFIRQHLDIDGDDHVVAHFRTPEDRRNGKPDHTLSLTEAVMEAFPDHSRYGTFALLSDTVGGLNNGGQASPGIVLFAEHLAHAGDAKSVFAEIGGFLWSRTGPGYLYNTFFAKGNVIETAKEDHRELDEAFGVFRAGGFGTAFESPLRLSRLVEEFKAPGTFAELPYIRQLNTELDAYWRNHGSDWTVLARYQFVLRARAAHASRLLTDDQFELVMRGGAPHVPLAGPVSMAQLRKASKGGEVETRRFDINGYTASDLVRFVAPDGSEVMYVPGRDPCFVPAGSESKLRQWVLEQAQDPLALDALLAHFSIGNSQDGMFWTGVRHGLEYIGSGRWEADGHSIDHANAMIDGDIFEDMRATSERRTRDDARMQSSNAWEAWRGTINRATALLAPLGFVRPLVLPVQLGLGVVQTGTGIEQGIDGRTWEERKRGFEQAGMTVVSSALMTAVFGGWRAGERGAVPPPVPELELRPLLAPPQRINGRIGYLAGPTRAPRFPGGLTSRLYLDNDGRLARWSSGDAITQTLGNKPKGTEPVSPDVFAKGDKFYVRLQNNRVAPVTSDGGGYRVALRNRRLGPRVARQGDGSWALASDDADYLAGSYLSNIVDDRYTTNPEILQRSAQILEQLGSSEANLRDANQRKAGPLARLSVGHAILETLSTRLRDREVTQWSPFEVELLLPSLAREVRRPFALYGEDGRFLVGLSADGTEFGARSVPADTIAFRHIAEQYVLADDLRAPLHSIFKLVGNKVGQVGRYWEIGLRNRLADAIDARSTARELELVHSRWIGSMDIPEGARQALTEISRLRHALVEKRIRLTPEQTARLRRADEARREALFPGETDPWPTVDELLAQMADPLRVPVAGERDHLMGLLARIVDEQDALLPRGLAHLVARNPPVQAAAVSQATDQWSADGRYYVRLRHPDGRAQVVETESPERGDYLEILAPTDGAPSRRTGRYVVDFNGAWFPEESVREGRSPMSPLNEMEVLATFDIKPPSEVEEDFTLVELMNKSIPQPVLRFVGTSLPEAGLAADGAVEFTVRHPATGQAVVFPTYLDIEGRPVPRPWRAALSPEAATLSADEHLVLPAREGTGTHHGVADPSDYIALLETEQPISAFIEAGYGDRHVKTLVQTRRLRGFLREDTHMAIVGATPEHVFSMILPVNAETVEFVSAGVSGSRPLAALPADTFIVDPMFGVRATAREYPARVRAVALQWEADGVGMKRIESNGTETRESPVAFTERLLSTPVRPNLWNPAGDPISEAGYVRYMRRMYSKYGTVRYAGLDWLDTRKARRDYMSYFAPPFDVMPRWDAPLSTESAAATMRDLAGTAIDVVTPSAGFPAM